MEDFTILNYQGRKNNLDSFITRNIKPYWQCTIPELITIIGHRIQSHNNKYLAFFTFAIFLFIKVFFIFF